MDRKKVLWKIEELWDNYFSLPLQDTKQSQYCNANLKKIHTFYKNNISIYNPDFHFVKKIQFQKSENVVHSDKYGEYFGLKYSQVLEKDGKLVYLFDNHNKIIQPFLEYVEIIGKSFDVVHIDAHEDDAVFPAEKPHHLELKNVKTYIEQTRISDFFIFLSPKKETVKQPLSLQAIVKQFFALRRSRLKTLSFRAIAKQSKYCLCNCFSFLKNVRECFTSFRSVRNDTNHFVIARSERRATKRSHLVCHSCEGRNLVVCHCKSSKQSDLIKNIYRYTKSVNFNEFKKPKNPYILSLDIDIFGPEGDFVDTALKVKIIAEAWKDADVVCIAMSPGFIDQEYAQEIIRTFLY